MTNNRIFAEKRLLNKLCSSFILAGLIVFFIGAYYSVIKAGIPYQDPPLELQIKYAINMGIGETLTKAGFLIVLYSGLVRFAIWLIFKYFITKS